MVLQSTDGSNVVEKTPSGAPASPQLAASNLQVDEKRNDIDTSLYESDLVRRKAAERRATRKLDVTILLVCTLYYLLSFLDRANIGNAKVAGLQADLRLNAHQYSVAITCTYILYIAAELPCNLLLKKIGPHIVLPVLVTSWSLVCIFQGFVKSYGGLIAARLILGMCEGGLLPGIVLYLSSFYRRQQFQLRLAILFSAASLAGAFSGLLAAAILKMEGTGGYRGWRWLFFIEGLVSLVLGIAVAWLIPKDLQHHKMLTQEEKDAQEAALREDGMIYTKDEEFNWKYVKDAFVAPQALIMSAIFFAAGSMLFSLAYFATPIIATLGYSGTKLQLMSVPPYAVSFVISVLVAIFADKYKKRGPVIIFLACISAIGYIMFLSTSNRHVAYGSLYFQVVGAYGMTSATSTWQATNLSGHTKRATGIAMGFIATNSGGILSTWLFPTTEGPRFHRGTSVQLGLTLSIIFWTFLNMVYLRWQNHRKFLDRASMVEHDESLTDAEYETERQEQGDKHRNFIYTL